MNRMHLVGLGALTLGAGALLGAGVASRLARTEPLDAPAITAAPGPAAGARQLVFTNVTVITNITVTPAPADTRPLRSDELVALESRLAQLNAQLTERDAAIARLRTELAEVGRARAPGERRREAGDDEPRRPREQDPERAAEIERQRAEFRQRMNEQVADRTTFLKLLDTSNMSEAELANHQDLLNRIEQTTSIVATLQAGRRPTPEERELLRENMRGMGERMEIERLYILRQTGRSLGYSDAEAQTFATHMSDLYEITSPAPPGLMFGGRGGPRERGPDQPPAAPPGAN